MKLELKVTLMNNEGEPVDPRAFRVMKGALTIDKMVCEFEEVLNLVWSKEQFYGGAWRGQGWMGNLARIMSKVSRLKNMQWTASPIESSSESVDDTLQDLVALAMFGRLNRSAGNVWGDQ